MEDCNDKGKMPELAKVKIENLEKVSDEYSDQKRQKTGNNDSNTCDTEALYGDNEYFTAKKLSAQQSVPTIEENT